MKSKDLINQIIHFPWELGEDPYWTNPENGVIWYIDKNMTDYAINPNKSVGDPLDAICFYVCERRDDKINPIDRVLIDKKSNDVLHIDTSLEGMAFKIDALRFINMNKTGE